MVLVMLMILILMILSDIRSYNLYYRGDIGAVDYSDDIDGIAGIH